MYLYPAMVFIPTAKYVCSRKNFEIQMVAAAAHQFYLCTLLPKLLFKHHSLVILAI